MRSAARSAVLFTSFLVAAPPLPALAQGVPATAQFTPSQRQEIIAIVRDALKSDPSILSDAIVSLRAQADHAQAVDARAALERDRAALAPAAGDMVIGRGSVTLTEFYDPRCPYCRKVLPDLDQLGASDSRLRLVEKLIPILGPGSVLEAKAIAAAGRQHLASALQHALMNDSAAPDETRVIDLARQAGLDTGRLQRDMADPAILAGLQKNIALAQDLGITGTPSFVVGDRIIPGAVDLTTLRQAVAAARAG